MAERSPSVVRVGTICGVHGIRGWVKVYSDTDPRAAILDYSPWLLGDPREPRTVKIIDGGVRGKAVAAALEGIDDRDTAARLIDLPIWIRRDQLPPLEEGFYWADLEGLTVETVDGRALGHVSHLLETGANNVLVVEGDRQRLIPWLMKRTIREVDLKRGVITVDWDPDF